MSVLVRLVNVLFMLYGLGLVVYAWAPPPRDAKFEAIRRSLGRFFSPPLGLLQHVVEPIRLGRRVLDLAPLFALVLVAIAWAIVHYIMTGTFTSSV